MAGARDVAVLAIHYQNDNCHADGRIRLGLAEADPRREKLVAAAGRLFAAARSAGVPIVHVRYAWKPDYSNVVLNAEVYRQHAALGAWKDGEWGAEFLDALRPAGEEAVVTHARMSPFYGSELEEVLSRLKPGRLIVAGVSTSYAVDAAVRDSSDRGYEVAVAADACATGDPAMHDASLHAMRMLATVSTVDELVAGI